ncbi:MAG TPA: DUF2628 domain-containing protein [Devosia sp.]|jgi:hypothetical protein|nr:DUF2628 domain-containing protein [Devosia sp.]
MTVYSIFEKPQGKAAKNRVPQFVPPVAVADRFSWLAALLPPVFAVFNGLILLLVFWIALAAGLVYASRVIGPDAACWLYVVVAVFLGFEAPAFRRDGLLARGFIWRGDVVAHGEDVAARDYLLKTAGQPK